MERKPYQWVIRLSLVLIILSLISLALSTPQTAEFYITCVTLLINLLLLGYAVLKLRKEPPHEPH